MRGDVVPIAYATSRPLAENLAPVELVLPYETVGLVYTVPNPDADHGQLLKYGAAELVDVCNVIAVDFGWNAIPNPLEVTSGAGLAALVPKPDDDHCHALIYGDAVRATAIAVSVNATLELAYPAVGRAAGLEILVPKPAADHGYTNI